MICDLASERTATLLNSLFVTTAYADAIKSLSETIGSLRWVQLHEYQQNGMTIDDFQQTKESLITLEDAFRYAEE